MSALRVAVAHGSTGCAGRADAVDVIGEAEQVARALEAVGHDAVVVEVGLDLSLFAGRMLAAAPDLVFNLVDSIDGHEGLQIAVPALLDALGIPYTGSRTASLAAAGNKLLMKSLLRSAGIRTPDWCSTRRAPIGGELRTYLRKPTWGSGSIGIADDVIVDAAPRWASAAVSAVDWNDESFLERFIDGREVHVSMLQTLGGLLVLPPAETVFRDYPPGKPRIVGYAAKWDSGAFEYTHTDRLFALADAASLVPALSELSRRVWRALHLEGYVRIDLRIDSAGAPWVIDVNPNPCLSPDAGFAAALDAAGISFEKAVGFIVKDVTARSAPRSDGVGAGV